MGRWADGPMGRWADGPMGRWQGARIDERTVFNLLAAARAPAKPCVTRHSLKSLRSSSPKDITFGSLLLTTGLWACRVRPTTALTCVQATCVLRTKEC